MKTYQELFSEAAPKMKRNKELATDMQKFIFSLEEKKRVLERKNATAPYAKMIATLAKKLESVNWERL